MGLLSSLCCAECFFLMKPLMRGFFVNFEGRVMYLSKISVRLPSE